MSIVLPMSKSKTELRTCIYCREEKTYSTSKSASEFNREHVIHDALLEGMKNVLTLHGLVCKGCNQYFGDTLDRSLLRSGYIGLLRFDQGVKDVDEYHQFAADSIQLTARSSQPAINGATVHRRPQDGKLVAKFGAKVAIELKSRWIQLTEEQIDKGMVPQAEDLAGSFKMMCDTDEEEKRIMNKLGAFYKLHPSEKKWIIGTIPVYGEGEMGLTEMRCLTKIAFNYLAFTSDEILHCRDILLYPCFDEVRRFIRYGDAPSFEVIAVETGPAGSSAMDQIERNRHIVTHEIFVAGLRKVLAAHVNLFDSVVWRVVLTPNYSGVLFPSRKGHVWHLKDKVCKPL